jgi:hypothetical protein
MVTTNLQEREILVEIDLARNNGRTVNLGKSRQFHLVVEKVHHHLL